MCTLQQSSRWQLLGKGMLGNYTLRKPLQVSAAKSGLSGRGWGVVGGMKVFPMTAVTKGSLVPGAARFLVRRINSIKVIPPGPVEHSPSSTDSRSDDKGDLFTQSFECSRVIQPKG